MKYSRLVEVYERLDGTSKRLEKTKILADFLRELHVDDVDEAVLLLQGKVFPLWDERKVGMAARMLVKVVSQSTGAASSKVEELWRKRGDLGLVVEELMKSKRQVALFSAELTVKKVFGNLQKLASLEGQGTVEKKVALVAELLTSASPVEAKYVVRTVLDQMRTGLGEGTFRDAVVWAFFGKEIGIVYDVQEQKLVISDEVRVKYNEFVQVLSEAFNRSNDFGVVVKAAMKGLAVVKKISFNPSKPVKVMLFQKVDGLEDGFARVGVPCAIEFKYDGFRVLIHKVGGKVAMYTRRLEEVTKQFPEVVEYVNEFVKGDNFVLDAECIGFDRASKKHMPFQDMSQRIKRKYDIEKLVEALPVEVNVFDVLYHDGENVLDVPFRERRAMIEKMVVPHPWKMCVARQIVTGELKVAEKFYRESLDAGNEGVMMKNLDGVYTPGSRVGVGVKVKPVMETLDVAIVGAEWGEGKRSKWLASFVIAVLDEGGNFVEIGKVGTGFKEKAEEGTSFSELTELLLPLVVEKNGREVRVKPSVVIEVSYEEVQSSPKYGSGFALRFPRLVRLRTDRRADEISRLSEVQVLYTHQRSRSA